MNLLRNVRNPEVKCNLLNKSADEKFFFFVTRNLLLITKTELTEDNTKARHDIVPIFLGLASYKF